MRADITEAQEQAAVSSRQADQDLTYQRAQAHDEHKNVAVPLRRTIEVNHIAEMIAHSLVARYSEPGR